jgi:hypothetical protein
VMAPENGAPVSEQSRIVPVSDPCSNNAILLVAPGFAKRPVDLASTLPGRAGD